MIETLIAVLVIAVAYGALMTVVAIMNRNEMQKWIEECDRLSEDLVTCFERYEGINAEEAKLLLPEILQKLRENKKNG